MYYVRIAQPYTQLTSLILCFWSSVNNYFYISRSNNGCGARHVLARHLGSVHGDPSRSPRGRSYDTHRRFDSRQGADGRRTSMVRRRRVSLHPRKCTRFIS